MSALLVAAALVGACGRTEAGAEPALPGPLSRPDAEGHADVLTRAGANGVLEITTRR